MIVLDENIGRDEWEILSVMGIRSRQIGFELADKGVDDEQQIIPLLRRLTHPTFFTRDFDFFEARLCDPRYCIACLRVTRVDSSFFIRRFLRHRSFRTHRARMGKIVQSSQAGIRILHPRAAEEGVAWEVK